MSIHSCVVTSWPMRAIGKRGARSSGPMGCLVPGCSGGDGGVGIEGTTLNHAVGIWFSRSRNLVSSDGIGSSLRLRSEKLPPRPGRKASLPDHLRVMVGSAPTLGRFRAYVRDLLLRPARPRL